MDSYQKLIEFLLQEDCIQIKKPDKLATKLQLFTDKDKFQEEKSIGSTSFVDDTVTPLEDSISPKLMKSKIKLSEKLIPGWSVGTTDLSSETLFSEEDPLAFSFKEDEKRYLILETLGEGGMGIVQRVQDCLLHREVALKSTKSASLNLLSKKQRILRWRFQREAEITALLEHPNIIPIYDMQHKENGVLHFTMRKVEGDTLSQILYKMKTKTIPLDEGKLLSIFFKICDAISYAHSRGIIHRDLKPDNIMVGQFGEVYVMDWGIAKKLEENLPQLLSEEADNISSSELLKAKEDSSENSFFKTIGGIGTPGYMAPEQQKQASEVTTTSDIFSLGKILKQLFTLKSPFEEFQEILKQMKSSVPKSAKKETAYFENEIWRQVPRDIQAIVKKATHPKSTERYNSVSELSEDVERYLKNFRISVREYNPFEVFSKWLQRHQKNISIVIFSIIVVISIYGLFFWIKKQQQLEKHLQRWSVLRETLKAPSLGDYEMVLAEIREMKEPEILHEVLKDLAEGTKYFLQEKLENAQLNSFYNFIPKVIGALENQATRDPLIHSLEQMVIHLVSKPKLERSLEKIDYMKSLVKGLTEGKIKGASLALYNVTYHMGFNSLFSEQTEKDLLFLAALDKGTLVPKTAKEFMIAGCFYYQMNQIEKAFEHLNKTISLQPDNSSAYRMRGLIFIKQKKYKKAIAEFDKTLQIETKDSFEKFILYHNRGVARSEADYLEDAIADFNRALFFNPNHDESYNSRAGAKYKLGDLAGALTDLNIAIRLNPRSFSAYKNRAKLKERLGNFREAIFDLDRTIQLLPDDLELYKARGKLKFKQKDLKGALKDFNRILEMKPSNDAAYFLRGEVKSTWGNLEEALLDYDYAIQLNPKNIQAFSYRGVTKQRLGRIDEALADFNQCILIDPKYSEAYCNRGAIFLLKRNFKKAMENFDKAIECDPSNSDAFTNRGNLKFQQGNFKEAILDLDQGIALNPKDVNAFVTRGTAKWDLKDFAGAYIDYSQALVLNPNYSRAYFNRGFVLWDQHKLKEAFSDFKEAARIDSTLAANCFFNMGELSLNMRNQKEALIYFEKGLKLKKSPKIQNKVVTLLIARCVKHFREKKFSKARADVLKMKKYAHQQDPRRKKIDEMLRKIAQAEEKEKKK